MPVKTAKNMKPDDLLQIRHMLGTYRLEKGGWIKLGENDKGEFFIASQLAGHVLPKLVPCEPEYIKDQKAYFDLHPEKIAQFECKHPELIQHFTRSGKPRTNQNIVEEFLDSDEGQAFIVTKGVCVKSYDNWFEGMQYMLKAAYGGKVPKLSKPFSLTEWAYND